MRKQPVLDYKELDVDKILWRQLGKQGYRILSKVKLCDALAKDQSDHLPQRKFDYFTRAHLDFLVTLKNIPIFAVEFDGAHHFADERTMENDVIKNELCKQAGLPLLRITSPEIEEHDHITLLDYMLMRYAAWQKEYPLIAKEIKKFAETVGPDYDPENLAVDLDPAFRFNLRHPFPARNAVVDRLWKNHKIAWALTKPQRRRGAIFLCTVFSSAEEICENEQFRKCTQLALVWRATGEGQTPLFSKEVSVIFRSWLPLRTDVPAPDLSLALRGSVNQPEQAQRLEEIINQFKIRVESMWLPELPGICCSDIAHNYAEYLGFRYIESWAKTERCSGTG
jgi:very-short-patch-repair endonuclease